MVVLSVHVHENACVSVESKNGQKVEMVKKATGVCTIEGEICCFDLMCENCIELR